jgi:adenylate cyclase class 2
MIEIEVKARVANLKEVEKNVREIGGVFIGKDEQEDIYFDAVDRNFREHDEVLRIRKTPHGDRVTYKKKRADKDARIRTEHEVKVESGDEFAELLKDLSFVHIAKIRKARESYSVSGCNVELDRVEGLGDFVEVEILIPENEDIAKGKERIFELLEKIGIQKENVEEKPYLELYLDKIGDKEQNKK